MTLTVQEALRHIGHTLASGTDMPAIGGMRILNDAGEWLGAANQWKWLEGASATLDFNAGTDFMWLPRNFRDLIAYNTTQGLTNKLILTTHQDIVELRTSEVTQTNWIYRGVITHKAPYENATGTVVFTGLPTDADTLIFDDGIHDAVTFEFDDNSSVTETDVLRQVVIGATAATTVVALGNAINSAPVLFMSSTDDATTTVTVTHDNPGTLGNIAITDSTANVTVTGMSGGRDGGAPRPRLDVWPDILSDDAGAVTIFYRAGWQHLDDDDEEVTVPDWLEFLYLQCVREVARGYEREDAEPMTARLNRLKKSDIWKSMVGRDAVVQPDYGPIRNGAAENAFTPSIRWWWNFTSTNDPS